MTYKTKRNQCGNQYKKALNFQFSLQFYVSHAVICKHCQFSDVDMNQAKFILKYLKTEVTQNKRKKSAVEYETFIRSLIMKFLF